MYCNLETQSCNGGEPSSYVSKTIHVLLATSSKLLELGFAPIIGQCSDMRLHNAASPADVVQYACDNGPPDVLIIEPGMLDAVCDAFRERGWQSRILVLWARRHAGQTVTPDVMGICGLLRICEPKPGLDWLLNYVASCRCPAARTCRDCEQCPARLAVQPPPLPLTLREKDVFRWIARGEGPTNIAGHLGVSVKTIEKHRESIKRKLGLEDAAALHEAAYLWRRGVGVTHPAQALDQVDSESPVGSNCLEIRD